MHRAAFERVVEILAMRSRTVDQRGAVRIVAMRLAERRAATLRRRGERGLHVVLVARGNDQAGDIEQKTLRRRHHRLGQRGGRCAGEPGAELLGRSLHAHAATIGRARTGTGGRLARAAKPVCIDMISRPGLLPRSALSCGL